MKPFILLYAEWEQKALLWILYHFILSLYMKNFVGKLDNSAFFCVNKTQLRRKTGKKLDFRRQTGYNEDDKILHPKGMKISMLKIFRKICGNQQISGNMLSVWVKGWYVTYEENNYNPDNGSSDALHSVQ